MKCLFCSLGATFVKSFVIFASTILYAVTFVPALFAIVGLLEMPIYMKSYTQRTAIERSWTDSSEELHQYAVKGDYLNFALHRMLSGLPSAVGSGCALGSLNIDRYKKKKKELDDIKKYKQ
jgi:hypothetical protein